MIEATPHKRLKVVTPKPQTSPLGSTIMFRSQDRVKNTEMRSRGVVPALRFCQGASRDSFALDEWRHAHPKSGCLSQKTVCVHMHAHTFLHCVFWSKLSIFTQAGDTPGFVFAYLNRNLQTQPKLSMHMALKKTDKTAILLKTLLPSISFQSSLVYH